MNLGFVEFWALRLEDSERHLKEGLALADEIGRPYVTLGCLGPLAHLANMEPRPDVGEERSRRAIELADQLGWSEDPIAGTAYLALGGGLISRGRLQEGESWLDRAEQVLEGLPDPEASVSLPYVRGVLRFQQQRYKEAIEWFRNAVARPRGGVPAPHFLSTSARAWELRARTRLGDLGPARSALAEADEAERGLVDWRNLAACLHLAEDKPKEAVEALAPVLMGLRPRCTSTSRSKRSSSRRSLATAWVRGPPPRRPSRVPSISRGRSARCGPSSPYPALAACCSGSRTTARSIAPSSPSCSSASPASRPQGVPREPPSCASR